MSGPAEDGPEQNGPREDGLAARAAQVALNLFRGYGYTFYRAENDLRADDQRIRRMVSELLQQVRKGLSEAEGRYRREVIPPPSRANPFPPAEMVANARRLEALAQGVSALDAQVAHLPVPTNDFMTSRYRNEAETLGRLAEKDVELVADAHALAEAVPGDDPLAVLDAASAITTAIARVKDRLAERQALLL
jgi:hypothetical protein